MGGPPQPQTKDGNIAYNVEHVFKDENGREVRKMPVEIDGETIWVECVPGGQGEGGADPIMMSLDDPDDIPKAVVKPPSISASSFTAEQRARIMREVLEEHISPADLSKKYNISAHAIRDWVKKAGRKLPKSYKRRNMPSTSEPVFKKKKSPRKIVLTKMMTIDDSSEEEIDFPFYPPPPARALQVKAESVQDHNVKIKNEYLEEEEGEVKKENIKGDMTINMKRENKTERGEMKEENFEEEGGEVKKETIKVVKKDNMKKERMTEIEEVKEENNSLKKEISRLQEENAGLRLEKREWKSKIKQEENTIKMEEVDEVNEPSKVEGKDGKGGGGN